MFHQFHLCVNKFLNQAVSLLFLSNSKIVNSETNFQTFRRNEQRSLPSHLITTIAQPNNVIAFNLNSCHPSGTIQLNLFVSITVVGPNYRIGILGETLVQ